MQLDDEEILEKLGVDPESDLGESFFECLGGGDEVTDMNDWLTSNGFALRVADLVWQSEDGESTWEMAA